MLLLTDRRISFTSFRNFHPLTSKNKSITPKTIRLTSVLPTLLGGHQEFLINDLWRRRSLCNKAQLKVVDETIDHGIVCDRSNDAHLAPMSISIQTEVTNHEGFVSHKDVGG